MIVLAVTIVICITAVTIVAMKCSTERMKVQDMVQQAAKSLFTEIMKEKNDVQ